MKAGTCHQLAFWCMRQPVQPDTLAHTVATQTLCTKAMHTIKKILDSQPGRRGCRAACRSPAETLSACSSPRSLRTCFSSLKLSPSMPSSVKLARRSQPAWVGLYVVDCKAKTLTIKDSTWPDRRGPICECDARVEKSLSSSPSKSICTCKQKKALVRLCGKKYSFVDAIISNSHRATTESRRAPLIYAKWAFWWSITEHSARQQNDPLSFNIVVPFQLEPQQGT